MKKYIYIILSLFLFMPFMVNAETLTYNVCESGCEYSSLGDVRTAIRNISDLSDKDIVVNINSDVNDYLYVGSVDNMINSVTINGNNHDFNNQNFHFDTKKVEINNCNGLSLVSLENSEKISIKNSDIENISYALRDSIEHIKDAVFNISEILDIDEVSLNNLKWIALVGNIRIENIDLSNQGLYFAGGTLNIYNSKIAYLENISYNADIKVEMNKSEIGTVFNYSTMYSKEHSDEYNDIVIDIYESKLEKIVNYPEVKTITANLYNSSFNSLKYVDIKSQNNPAFNEYLNFLTENANITYSFKNMPLNNDIYDLDGTGFEMQSKSTTNVYFDKETKLKPDDKLNLVNYLDYYTEDKEIEYTIEDESIAKIENKELIGLKEGNTKVTVTTDEGHVIYRINLVVEKESLPEKIDKMTIKVPITGSKIKLWVLIVGAILLGIIGTCVYMLIKRKK